MQAYSLANGAAFSGVLQSADPLYAFSSYGTIAVTSRFTDLLGTSSSIAPYTAFGSGTGNGSNWYSAVAGRIGLLTIETGTTTGGSHFIGTNTSAAAFGSGTQRFRCDLFVPTASDGTDTFTVRSGYIDATSGECIDGAYFRYTHSVNSGKWECVTRSNSTETAADSGVAGVSATCQTLEIEVNAAATSVVYKINGATVQTIATNIPSGTTRATGVGATITKSAGTTNRTVVIDLMADRFERTTSI